MVGGGLQQSLTPPVAEEIIHPMSRERFIHQHCCIRLIPSIHAFILWRNQYLKSMAMLSTSASGRDLPSIFLPATAAAAFRLSSPGLINSARPSIHRIISLQKMDEERQRREDEGRGTRRRPDPVLVLIPSSIHSSVIRPPVCPPSRPLIHPSIVFLPK